jgi:2-polyprenyl-6-methoxyphenol hydroxylase-like FAD-dependent oxidoreductase
VLDQRGNALETTDHVRLSERFRHVSAVALHRAALHEALLSGLPRNCVHTGKRCTAVREQEDQVALRFEDGEETRTDLLFACDGIHSVVRTSLYPQWRERFAGYTCWRGIAPMRPHGVELGQVTQTWGRGRRFGIVPLADQSVYWFACVSADAPTDEDLARVKLPELRALSSEFQEHVRELLDATSQDSVIWTDIFDVPPKHHYTRNRIVLLGDAAHAVTPISDKGRVKRLKTLQFSRACSPAIPCAKH